MGEKKSVPFIFDGFRANITETGRFTILYLCVLFVGDGVDGQSRRIIR
jgi:hypothetical protein